LAGNVSEYTVKVLGMHSSESNPLEEIYELIPPHFGYIDFTDKLLSRDVIDIIESNADAVWFLSDNVFLRQEAITQFLDFFESNEHDVFVGLQVEIPPTYLNILKDMDPQLVTSYCISRFRRPLLTAWVNPTIDRLIASEYVGHSFGFNRISGNTILKEMDMVSNSTFATQLLRICKKRVYKIHLNNIMFGYHILSAENPYENTNN
jgi:hypothetical protein